MWKLSSNENPAPLSPVVLSAIAEGVAEANRYPDMAAASLVETLVTLHELVPGAIAVGNGSVALIENLLTAYCREGDEVVFPWRSFEAYPICIQVAGATPVPVPLTDDGRHDIAALVAAVTPRTRVMILCSPNNPTGPVLTESETRALLDTVPRTVLVALDEAYIEYVRDPSAVNGCALLDEYPNLVSLRTFSKAYGLAGLRVGYALGNPEVLGPVRAASTPFGVNSLAQRAAVASLMAPEAALASVAENVAERTRVLDAVRAAGWDVPDSQGNFFWLALGEDSARFIVDANAHGILVRGFLGDGVRISIGEREANDAVIEFLKDWARP